MAKTFIAWKQAEHSTSLTWFDSEKGPQTATVAGIYPAKYILTEEGDDGGRLLNTMAKDGYIIQELGD
jgi:hypothetical protein